MSCERITDHVQRGLDRRAGPFMSEGVAKLLTPLLEEVQDLEDLLWVMFNGFLDPDNASGDQLRILGQRVGEDPLDDSEDDYRLRIKLKIRAAVSSGKIATDFPDLLALLGESLVWSLQETPAWIRVTLSTGSIAFSPESLHRILSFAASAGIDVILIAPSQAEESGDLMHFGSYDATISGSNWPSFDGNISGANWAAAWSDS